VILNAFGTNNKFVTLYSQHTCGVDVGVCVGVGVNVGVGVGVDVGTQTLQPPSTSKPNSEINVIFSTPLILSATPT
jgi:hypothetical protein